MVDDIAYDKWFDLAKKLVWAHVEYCSAAKSYLRAGEEMTLHATEWYKNQNELHQAKYGPAPQEPK